MANIAKLPELLKSRSRRVRIMLNALVRLYYVRASPRPAPVLERA